MYVQNPVCLQLHYQLPTRDAWGETRHLETQGGCIPKTWAEPAELAHAKLVYEVILIPPDPSKCISHISGRMRD